MIIATVLGNVGMAIMVAIGAKIIVALAIPFLAGFNMSDNSFSGLSDLGVVSGFFGLLLLLIAIVIFASSLYFLACAGYIFITGNVVWY